MEYTRSSAFHLQNILSWLSVPCMHGIVLQMLVFFRLYSATMKVAFCMMTVLLEHLIDCSIRVSRSCIM